MAGSDERMQAGDPARIRALAHPIRLALLEVLGDVVDATATECAERVGESVASASFHLRQLEKYGYIERAEPRGREKPWRLVARTVRHPAPTPDVADSMASVLGLAGIVVDRQYARLREYIAVAERGGLEDDWLGSSMVGTSSFWATRDELAELGESILALLEPFEGRIADPTLRPEGARLARMFATLNADPDSVPTGAPTSTTDETGAGS
ncbi:transcriptional regulator [Agromyces rhizosphaerae]|uniref:Transcriptional regulator n=1 Tax=Agromyces rhizosphaerae TaxID=88374 RepID=A0A9W6CXR7_9MICO|nr:winged helix-turn-helix domain-containing protein [Agromyces rhizosphaerae]GLI28270.1 transcriptional regulator [Agromyces rhizosphaerae]